MISSGKPSNSRKMITDKVKEADVLGWYLGITSIPCVINSPFRQDKHPSLAFYSPDGEHVNYIDFGDKSNHGSMMTFFMKLWNLDYNSTVDRIVDEVTAKNHIPCKISSVSSNSNSNLSVNTNNIELKCKTRKWKDYDIKYWESYGISLKWLKWANVYPVSHKFIIKDGKEMVFVADKYCYAFIEFKEGRTTMKFYQPFNTKGYKWQNSHDRSVLGLWTKLPQYGDSVCICSSIKDALCLMANINIPCICLQGEGYPISQTAMDILKKRFIDIYVCLDNDETGLKDAEQLCKEHTLINVVIPQFEGGKDIADYYYHNGKESFISLFTDLFTEAKNTWYNELPF